MNNYQYKSQDIINDRYRIIKQLGIGSSAITYQAEDLQTNQQVAIKVLSLQQLEDWKKIELFEREAHILSTLNHPQIPQYLDYFQIDNNNDQSFYLVQQLAKGKSLLTLIEEGWQPNENEVKNIAIQLLEILVYLQQHNPPVFHRDIKPENIIYQPNKQVFLVDFGGVQHSFYHSVTASTIVGTYGYMSPEQFRGKANTTTDLYGLGTTLIFLLTGKHPSSLPQQKLKVKFKNELKTNINSEFYNWINLLIKPNYKKRFTNAQIALNTLQNKDSIDNYITLEKPINTSVCLKEDNQQQLIIDIPPALFFDRPNIGIILLTISWFSLLFFLLYAIVSTFNFFISYVIVITYIFYLLCKLVLITKGEDNVLKKIGNFSNKLKIHRLIYIRYLLLVIIMFSLISNKMTITYSIWLFYFFFLADVKIDIETNNLKFYLLKDIFFKTHLKIKKIPTNKAKIENYSWLNISAIDIQATKIGYLLTTAEKNWLTSEINNFLN